MIPINWDAELIVIQLNIQTRKILEIKREMEALKAKAELNEKITNATTFVRRVPLANLKCRECGAPARLSFNNAFYCISCFREQTGDLEE